jgi:hypothetical protein
MRTVRNRRSRNTVPSIPRAGFLLFILALAIVVWPKLRQAQESATVATSSSKSNLIDDADDVVSPIVNLGDAANAPDSTTPGDIESSASRPDENPAIDAQTRDLLSLMVDNTLRMSKREMHAYWELVRKSSNLTYQRLREEANSKIKFNDFYSEPSKHRGELVGLEVTVRRVNRYDAEAGNLAGVPCVYEIWGSTQQSQSWLYVFITDALPEGATEETLLRKNVKFAGYFVKLLAYQPGNAPPNAKPLLAPLLIGQFKDLEQTVEIPKDDTPDFASWGLTAILLLIASYFTLRVFLTPNRKWGNRNGPRNDAISEFDPSDWKPA